MTMTLSIATIHSPLGPLKIALSDRGICGLTFADGWATAESGFRRRFGPQVTFVSAINSSPASTAVERYFAGELHALDELELDTGGTEFQERVWARLREVPSGETISYGQLAAAIGCPNASRAVGHANATNPVCLVIPCHRVIQAGGKIGNYGGGVDRKEWLLHHETLHARMTTHSPLIAG